MRSKHRAVLLHICVLRDSRKHYLLLLMCFCQPLPAGFHATGGTRVHIKISPSPEIPYVLDIGTNTSTSTCAGPELYCTVAKLLDI